MMARIRSIAAAGRSTKIMDQITCWHAYTAKSEGVAMHAGMTDLGSYSMVAILFRNTLHLINSGIKQTAKVVNNLK